MIWKILMSFPYGFMNSLSLSIQRGAIIVLASSLLITGHCFAADATNPEQEIKKFSIAAEQGDIAAQMELARLYFIMDKKVEAAAWVHRAAEAGDANAQLALSMLYKQGNGVEQDLSQSTEWLKKAVKSGSPEATFQLAVAYYQGNGVQQDYQRAAKLFKEMAKKGNPDAQYNLAIMYRDGKGVSQSIAESTAWLALAAQGYVPGPRHNAVMQELEDLKNGLSAEEDKKARKIYESNIARFFKQEAAPILPPDQDIEGNYAITPSGSNEEARFSGLVQTGLRWQSNANSGASSYLNNPNPPSEALPIEDINLFALAKVLWIEKIESDQIDNIETSFTFYKTSQDDNAIADVNYAEVTTGPNIPLYLSVNRHSIRPYLIGSFIETDNKLYQTTIGTGIGYEGVFSKDMALLLGIEQNQLSFEDTALSPANSDASGNLTEISGRYLHRLTPWLIGNISLTYDDYNANEDPFSYHNIIVANGYTVKLPPLLKNLNKPTILYGSVSYQRREYDTPNPLVSSITAREDDKWQLTLTGSLPIAEQWAISPTFQQTYQDSSLPNYKYHNTLFSLMAVYKF
jgi:hypothetical protein